MATNGLSEQAILNAVYDRDNGRLNTSAGGGDSEKVEDAAHTTGDTGTFVLAVRNDAGTALAGDGDYIALTTDNTGQLRVTGGGTSAAEDSVAGDGDEGVPILFEAEDPTSMQTITEGDYVRPMADLSGRQITTLGTYLNESDTPTARIGASATVTGMSTLFDSDGDNTAQAIKTASGNLYKLHVYNSNGADAFVQLFDAATGSVTVGTTTPKYVVFVPSGGAVIEDFDTPMTFSTAITYACTTTATGSGDPTTGLTVSVGYV